MSAQHKKAMKKDVGESTGKSKPESRSNSRPGSANSRPGSARSTTKGTTSKNRKDDLSKENTELTIQVETLTGENAQLKEKLQIIFDKLLEKGKSKGVVMSDFETTDVIEVPTESIVTVINQVAANPIKAKKRNTIENRVEELETRITHLNMELAKLLRLRLDLEGGLEQIQQCNSLEEIKTKARFLLYEAEGSKLFTYVEEDELLNSLTGSVAQNGDLSAVEKEQQVPASPTAARQNSAETPLTIQLNSQTFDLTPPAKKMPAETHMRNMHPELKKYVMQELSLYKGNGADWRLLGERIGIPLETIQQWKRWKLDCPMQYVLQTWSQSPAATMRMLHRHLVSPQMRCILLAKRLSDFYQVD